MKSSPPVSDNWEGSLYHQPAYSRLQRYFDKKIISDCIVQHQISSEVRHKRILDVGCGDGYLTTKVAKKLRPKMAVGIDSSKSMISVAKDCYHQKNSHLIFSQQDITAKHIPLYGQFKLVVSFLCLHWVLEQDKALRNIAQALHDGGYGYLFISAKSPVPRHTPRSYIDIIKYLITHRPEFQRYFKDFCITRANLTKENYPDYIERAGLQLVELVEMKEPFIFEDKAELSRFFQGIVAGFLIFREKPQLSRQAGLAKIAALCNDLAEELLTQPSYKQLNDGKIQMEQNFLLAIVKKPGFADQYGPIENVDMEKFIVRNSAGKKISHPFPELLLNILDSGPPAVNTRHSYNESENQANFLMLR